MQSEGHGTEGEAAKETAEKMLKDGTFSTDRVDGFVSIPIGAIQGMASLQLV